MALNTNAALLQLSPLAPLRLDLPDRKAASMERERLQLMREQFEETKRRNVEDDRLRAMEEAGRTTRERMQNERAAAQAKAAQDAVTLQNKRAAYDDFLKYRDTGDYEGMEAGAARLHQLGADVERLGQDENGLPSWRIELDADQARADEAAQEEQAATYGPNETAPQSLDRLNALGYDTLGARDSLADTENGAAAPLSTEDAFRQAQAATRAPDEAPEAPAAPPEDTGVSAYDYAGEQDAAKDFAEPGRSTPMTPPPALAPSIFQATGRPAKGPDATDFQGGVPKNVLDFGAMNAQTQQRLGPVMADIEKSMPQAYRAETQGNNRAAAGMGLPIDKAVEQSLKLRAPAEAALKDELGHGYDVEKDARKAAADAALDPLEQQKMIKSGREAAEHSYDRDGVKDSLATIQAVDTVSALLDDKFPQNDDYAINFLMRLAEQKGAQSDKDAMRMDGINAASTTEQIAAWIQKHVEGGTYEPFKNAMKSFAQRQRAQHQGTVFSWIDSTHDEVDKAEHPLEGKGRNEVVESLPSWILKEYNDSQAEEQGDEPEQGAEPEQPAPSARGSGAAAGVANDEPLYQAPPPPPPGALQNDTAFMSVLDAEAKARGLDPDKMLAIVGPESGGNPAAKNSGSSASGMIQMIDSVARQYINPRTDKNFESAAELRELTRAEQAPIMAKYFADKGVTEDSPVEDYALAVAAPAFVGRSAERDTVVYPKGSVEHRTNRPWWPEDGGDVTVGSLLDFYMHTGEKKKPRTAGGVIDAPEPAATADAEAEAEDDEPPATDAAERVRQLLRKAQK